MAHSKWEDVRQKMVARIAKRRNISTEEVEKEINTMVLESLRALQESLDKDLRK